MLLILLIKPQADTNIGLLVTIEECRYNCYLIRVAIVRRGSRYIAHRNSAKYWWLLPRNRRRRNRLSLLHFTRLPFFLGVRPLDYQRRWWALKNVHYAQIWGASCMAICTWILQNVVLLLGSRNQVDHWHRYRTYTLTDSDRRKSNRLPPFCEPRSKPQ